MNDNVIHMPGNQKSESEKNSHTEPQITTSDGLVVLCYQNMLMAFEPEAAVKAGEAMMAAGIEIEHENSGE